MRRNRLDARKSKSWQKITGKTPKKYINKDDPATPENKIDFWAENRAKDKARNERAIKDEEIATQERQKSPLDLRPADAPSPLVLGEPTAGGGGTLGDFPATELNPTTEDDPNIPAGTAPSSFRDLMRQQNVDYKAKQNDPEKLEALQNKFGPKEQLIELSRSLQGVLNSPDAMFYQKEYYKSDPTKVQNAIPIENPEAIQNALSLIQNAELSPTTTEIAENIVADEKGNKAHRLALFIGNIVMQMEGEGVWSWDKNQMSPHEWKRRFDQTTTDAYDFLFRLKGAEDNPEAQQRIMDWTKNDPLGRKYFQELLTKKPSAMPKNLEDALKMDTPDGTMSFEDLQDYVKYKDHMSKQKGKVPVQLQQDLNKSVISESEPREKTEREPLSVKDTKYEPAQTSGDYSQMNLKDLVQRAIQYNQKGGLENIPRDLTNKLESLRPGIMEKLKALYGPSGKQANRLSLRADTNSVDLDNWLKHWDPAGGDSPAKKRRPWRDQGREQFHNKPSGYTPGVDGQQGNLHDVGPQGGLADANYLAKVIRTMDKTSNNDMFDTYSYTTPGNAWVTYTLFKKANLKFRPGDIVIQYGNSLDQCNTHKRRFGSVRSAKSQLNVALKPVFAQIFEVNFIDDKIAAVVSVPTPTDSFHEQQKSQGEPGGSYTRTNPYDKKPWQGNRDGFDAKNTPREKTKRPVGINWDTSDTHKIMGKRAVGISLQISPAGWQYFNSLQNKKQFDWENDEGYGEPKPTDTEIDSSGGPLWSEEFEIMRLIQNGEGWDRLETARAELQKEPDFLRALNRLVNNGYLFNSFENPEGIEPAYGKKE